MPEKTSTPTGATGPTGSTNTTPEPKTTEQTPSAQAPQPQTIRDAVALTDLPGTTDEAVVGPFAYGSADGSIVRVPKTPEEIAREGTALGVAGAFATGGSPAVAEAEGEVPVDPTIPTYQRVWGMDADHTTDNRSKPDQLHPDCSVVTGGKLT